MKISKLEWLTLVAGILIVGGLIAINGGLRLKDGSQKKNMSEYGQNISKDTRIEIYDVKEGSGKVAEAGKEVKVNYVGTFVDGRKFDSSYDRNAPFEFTLGKGQVIKGWDIGVEGMKVGGKRHLVITYELGYGAEGYGPIPPKATLVFDVELLDVK